MSIVIAILGLGLLIVFHEGGHYLMARATGMRVERFSIGFGPTVLGFKRGETLFQIAPIPLGGFVQITGMNPHEEFDPADPRVYPNKPWWARLATILAGPIANYLIAFFIILFVLVAFGKPVRTHTIVDDPIAGKPAASAGLAAGDEIVRAGGKDITADMPLNEVVGKSAGKPLEVEVKRGGQTRTFTVTPEKQDNGGYLIGVKLRFQADRERGPLSEALQTAVTTPFVMSIGILKGLADIVTLKQKPDVSGPVGITKAMAKAVDLGALAFLEFMAMLSVYLGLFNLLPIPALDGGRALFLGFEVLTRRRVNAKFETLVHTVGFVFLLGLLVLVTFKDISRLISG